MDIALAQMNLWAESIVGAAWPLFWQSSVLIALLVVLDLVLKKQLRASVRYAFWLVLLLKLVLPPTLALPTGIGWWARQQSTARVPVSPSLSSVVVRYGPMMSPLGEPKVDATTDSVRHAILTRTAWAVSFSGGVSLGLFLWMLIRWRQVVLGAQPALTAPEWLDELFAQTRRSIGLRGCVRLGIMDQAVSPAVCGLFRPIVLVPRALVEGLSAEQMRAIFLHELIHLKRGDVWVNCAQALLQIAYWWHPLLWLANARIRRVREEAVDDAVMAALEDKADAYAPTLVQVARLALNRPITALGLVGILESPSALRQRIERLLEFRPPRRAGLTLASALCILGFAAMALPMGPAPETAKEAATEVSPAERKAKVNTLVQDAKLLYEMGKNREAESKLQLALQEDQTCQAAYYYLNQIRESEYHQKARNSKINSPGGPPTNPPPNELMWKTPGEVITNELTVPSFNTLYTRIFKVDPRTFAENLRNLTGATPESTNSTFLALKEFVSNLGLDLTPPKTLYYNDREGVLLVRASLADLDTIENAINELSSAPPQINVKVKFVELPVKLAKDFWEGLTNSATRVAILTDPQARVALHALESQEGVSVVNQANVTTLSGRQTELQWAAEMTVSVLTNVTLTNASSPTTVLATNKVPIGSKVDIYPVVGTNGYSIQLTVSGSTTEFLGYDDPGQFVPQADADGSNKPHNAVLPLPRFRVLQMPTHSAIVWDGQTLVLGRSGQTTHASDVPVFGGDRPLVGRLFRSEPDEKDFIIFLTPTIIDPAGNRVHSDDDSPGPDPKSR